MLVTLIFVIAIILFLVAAGVAWFRNSDKVFTAVALGLALLAYLLGSLNGAL